ncbi:MAG TPA: winged helix-turn-helix transcriptional regulator [Firmicutes bacterium]|nr:winged helix-turn-helix transcriptional regulator [Bacillota bacterium]
MGRSWEEEVVTYPGLSVSLSDYEVRVDGQPVPFTRKEIELLWVLASNPGRAFTREQLIERVWGGDFYGDDRTVDVHIKRIREKLSAGARGATGAKGASEAGEAGEVEQGGGEEAREIRQAPTAAEMERREEHPWRIKTVWGVGYKFELLD